MLDTNTSEDAKTVRAPPYVSFLTLKTLLMNFKEHGTPGRIDRTVLPGFSGSVTGQLLPALRFLKLIDAGNHPTNRLRDLVTNFDTDGWPEDLKALLRESYEPLLKLNLQTAAPSQFDEAFSKAFPGAENVIRKSKTFFLAAATEAKIPISQYIMRNKKPRSGPSKKRAPKPNGGKTEKAQSDPKGTTNATRNTPDPKDDVTRPMSQQLLEILDLQKMQPDEVEAVWLLLKYLRKEGR